MHRDHSDCLLFAQANFQTGFARKLDLLASRSCGPARLNLCLSPHRAPAKTSSIPHRDSRDTLESLSFYACFDLKFSATPH